MPADVAVASPGVDSFGARDKAPSRRSILASMNPADQADGSPTSNTDAILRSRRPGTANSHKSNTNANGGVSANGSDTASHNRKTSIGSSQRKVNDSGATEPVAANGGSRLSVPESNGGYANGSAVR